MAENKNAQQVREITDKLEQGIKELFESERFKEYLRTMSKFYNYSFNNTLLIAMQKPEATYVAGYTSWQRNFDRQVMKGEKGIKILAPAPYKSQEEREKIDQPPLSRQIQDLEEELGTKLFERSPHKVKLTEEGELFLQYASQILDLVNRSEEEVRIRKEGLQGTLYIASVEGCGPHLFAHWISEFQKMHPHVQYILWNGNTDDVNNRVTKGLCEVAMITAPFNTEEFHVLEVYEEPWVAMIPKGHPLYSETNEPINPNELLPYDLLIPSRESRQGEIHGWFSDPQSMPIIRGRVAHMMNAYELSKNGVGIAIYPESISSLVRDREVCIRQINHPDAKAFYALIWKKDRVLSHAAEAFIEFIKKNKEGVQ